MRAGRLSKMLTLIRRSGAVSSLGQPSQTWVAVRVPFSGALEMVTGTETWTGAHFAAKAEGKVICRYWSDILVTDRIRCDGKDYEILAVLDSRMKHRDLELPVRWVRNMGDGAAG